MRRSELQERRALPSLGVLVTLLCLTVPSAAQESMPLSTEGPSITLSEAVSTTVAESLNLSQAEQNLENRRGEYQRAKGTFDKVFFLTADFDLVEQELLRAGRDEEIKRRAGLEYLGGWPTDGPPFSFRSALDIGAERIEELIDPNGTSFLSDCLEGQSTNIVNLGDDQSDSQLSPLISRYRSSTVVLCLNPDGSLGSISPGANPDFQGRLVFSDTPRLLEILSDLGRLDDETREALEAELRAETTAFLDELRRQFRAVAADLRIARARLGDLPEVEELLDLKLDIGMRRKFRTGPSLTASVAMVGTEDNFIGKGYDPRDGDKTSPNTFTTSAGLRLVVPLGKGRGRIPTTGAERAASAILSSEKHLYVHEASKEALATVKAYWTLAAAQERTELLARSVTAQREIRDATRELVDAQELPGVELWRVEGRYAELQGQLGAAERALIEARLDLQLAMGRNATSLGSAPFAAEALPGAAEFSTEPETWLQQAQESRQDLEAARESTRASSILAETARANLRRQFDFFANVSFSGYHESWTRDQRIWDPSGYIDAVEGKGLQTLPGDDPEPALPQLGMTGPSFTVGVKFSLPFRNLAAEGQLVSAEASRAQSEIAESDIRRTIQLRLRDLLPGLELKRAQLAALQVAVESQQRTFDASRELYRLGELSLIDTIKTEEDLTNTELDLIDLKLDLVQLENEIRFEAGRLLMGPVDLESFEPASLKLAATGKPGESMSGS